MAQRTTERAPTSPVRGEAGDERGRSTATDEPDDGISSWPTPPASLRHRILFQLRLDGPSSPDDLAGRLGASRTGILQQLRALEEARLVSRTTERHGVGRPRHRYDVTPAAQRLFPAAYDGLASGLLAAIAEIGGPTLLEQVFDARRVQQAARIRAHLADRLPAEAPLADRVRELAVVQDEQGYLAEMAIGSDGVIRLRERNCAIHHIAQGQPAACHAELALFGEVLGADVVREEHIASGDRCCTYRISEPGAGPADATGDDADEAIGRPIQAAGLGAPGSSEPASG